MSPVLGELAFFFGIVQPFNVRARPDGDVQLLVLSKADSDELFHNYPEQLEIVRSNLLAAIGLDEAGNSVAPPAAADQEDEDPDVALVKENIRESLRRVSLRGLLGGRMGGRGLSRERSLSVCVRLHSSWHALMVCVVVEYT